MEKNEIKDEYSLNDPFYPSDLLEKKFSDDIEPFSLKITNGGTQSSDNCKSPIINQHNNQNLNKYKFEIVPVYKGLSLNSNNNIYEFSDKENEKYMFSGIFRNKGSIKSQHELLNKIHKENHREIFEKQVSIDLRKCGFGNLKGKYDDIDDDIEINEKFNLYRTSPLGLNFDNNYPNSKYQKIYIKKTGIVSAPNPFLGDFINTKNYTGEIHGKYISSATNGDKKIKKKNYDSMRQLSENPLQKSCLKSSHGFSTNQKCGIFRENKKKVTFELPNEPKFNSRFGKINNEEKCGSFRNSHNKNIQTLAAILESG
ncbi:hypothetical protein AYI68_g4137 [Smittium mucronatum]|uniref:Uncharacterized protein n=1 Tax=Smittium mucronatum TaxID=133383 RepID=A0A1R0GXW7_9FUNG|nr:hypothetical protein AYI68_g4137 [Smittium mucronatum]